jgi:hypothetical protein
MTSMDDFLKNNCNSSGSINWFNYFFNEPLPRKRFKPYNHSIRRRQEYHFNFNGFTCDQCQVISINGLPCHEIGCINSHKIYNHDQSRWVEYIACSDCGYDIENGECCDCTSHRNPDFSYFDDDDVMTVEQNLSHTSLWQQYDQ